MNHPLLRSLNTDENLGLIEELKIKVSELKKEVEDIEHEINGESNLKEEIEDLKGQIARLKVRYEGGELTDEQKKDLAEIVEHLPPECACNITFLDSEERECYSFDLSQDNLPVIRAYLDLADEKMNS